MLLIVIVTVYVCVVLFFIAAAVKAKLHNQSNTVSDNSDGSPNNIFSKAVFKEANGILEAIVSVTKKQIHNSEQICFKLPDGQETRVKLNPHLREIDTLHLRGAYKTGTIDVYLRIRITL